MNQEVFKTGMIKSIILPVLIATVLLVVYFSVDDIPTWILIFLIIPIVFAIAGQTTKLVLEDDMLHHYSGILVKNVDKVPLHDVAQIVTRVVESWGTNTDGQSELQREKVTYVLDAEGRTIFTFSADLISGANRQRFVEGIHNINPNIIIH